MAAAVSTASGFRGGEGLESGDGSRFDAQVFFSTSLFHSPPTSTAQSGRHAPRGRPFAVASARDLITQPLLFFMRRRCCLTKSSTCAFALATASCMCSLRTRRAHAARQAPQIQCCVQLSIGFNSESGLSSGEPTVVIRGVSLQVSDRTCRAVETAVCAARPAASSSRSCFVSPSRSVEPCVRS